MDCITILTKEKLIFYGSKEKVEFLQFLVPIFDKSNKKLVFIIKEKGKILEST